MESYSLGLYEKALPPDLGFARMLSMTSFCGFDRLEISIDESDYRLSRLEWNNQQIDELARMASDANVSIKTMCLSGHRRYPFGSHDQVVRERSIDILKKAVDFAARLGVSIIQLAGYDVYYEESDQITTGYFAENLAYAVEYSSKQGVILAFETMETPFMDTVKKAMVYVNRIKSPWLGVYPDIGNLKNASVKYGTDLLADIDHGAGHIFAIHLKETQPGVYRDMVFGTGHTEYYDCLRKLWQQGVRMFTGEMWYDGKSDAEEVISDASQFLRSRIDEVVKPTQQEKK